MASVLDICNEALAAIAAGSIASTDEQSVEARECKRAYDGVVSDMLEEWDWGIAIRRIALAGIANDRPSEWAFAYAKPVGTASLRRVLPRQDVAFPLVGWWPCRLWDQLGVIPFIEDAGTIYTNVETAVLEYTVSAVDAGTMPSMFRRAVVYGLASRIAMPIRKDRQIMGDMLKLAEAWLAKAMTDDQNRYPRIERGYISEAELVRGGAWIGLHS